MARHLGLSRWTVSRVLNGHVGVLPETVERVHRAMAELGFQPNALARSLRGGRSGAIGVCFQELESPLLARKVALLQQALRQRGYRALIELTNGDRELERQAVVHFLSMQVEGMVLIGSQLEQDDPTLAMVLGQKLPVMWIDPENRQKGDQIAIDRVLSMRLVLDHLVALGHRRIGVIGIDPQNPYGAFRIPAIESHAQVRGLDVENDLLIHYHPGHKDHDYAYGEQLTRELLEHSGRLPTALIALNDRVAIGAMAHLRKVGIDVPQQMSVVGYDNLGVSDYLSPTLTSVDHDAERLMASAAQLLVERIETRNGEGAGGAVASGVAAAAGVAAAGGSVLVGGGAAVGMPVDADTAVANMLVEPKLIVRGSTAQAQ